MADKQDPRSPGFDIRVVNQTVIAEYRATGGVLEKTLPGSKLVLLTTTGRRTEKEHTTPLGYVTDGSPDRIVVFASNMASPDHPDWYRNLTTSPKVLVELGTERFEAEASTASGPERERLYESLVETMPGIRGHQEQVEREIPVVLLVAVR
jgi:deazaflavin-dependent oxidoreductase (nitroreductase family)